MFVGETGEVVGGGGVFGVDSANAVKDVRGVLEDVGEIAVVPTVVNDLDENGAKDLTGVHEIEELLDGCIFGGWLGFGGKGEGWVMLPHVDV